MSPRTPSPPKPTPPPPTPTLPPDRLFSNAGAAHILCKAAGQVILPFLYADGSLAAITEYRYQRPEPPTPTPSRTVPVMRCLTPAPPVLASSEPSPTRPSITAPPQPPSMPPPPVVDVPSSPRSEKDPNLYDKGMELLMPLLLKTIRISNLPDATDEQRREAAICYSLRWEAIARIRNENMFRVLVGLPLLPVPSADAEIPVVYPRLDSFEAITALPDAHLETWARFYHGEFLGLMPSRFARIRAVSESVGIAFSAEQFGKRAGFVEGVEGLTVGE